MFIKSSAKHLTTRTSRTDPSGEAKVYVESKLPCHTKDYVLRTKAEVNLTNPTLETYRKVCGASGAVRGAWLGHATMLGGGAVLGATLGSLVPGGGAITKVLGGVLGLAGGAFVQGKTMIGRKAGSIAGGLVGQAVSPAIKALNIPVSEERAEINKDFSVKKLWDNGGEFFHSSIPNITSDEGKEFVNNLVPGDVVLTKHEGSSIFNILTYLPSGEYDFNHAILYMGEGKAIEATTGVGVHEFDLAEELTHKHHCIAVRPKTEEGQVEKVLDAAQEMKGKPYDYTFKSSADSIYCSELVSAAYKEGAPQVKFNGTRILSKAFVLPGDLRHVDGDVIAEAGEHHSYLTGMSSKFS